MQDRATRGASTRPHLVPPVVRRLERVPEALKAATKPDKAKEVYAKARVSMNGYLDEVELPPLGDQRYAL